MGRQRWVYRLEPPRFPDDFPKRLERFKVASGLSWRGLARELCIDIRLVKRWRKGAKPDSANLIALFSLAARIGLLHLLLPEVSNCQVKEVCPKKQTCVDLASAAPRENHCRSTAGVRSAINSRLNDTDVLAIHASDDGYTVQKSL